MPRRPTQAPRPRARRRLRLLLPLAVLTVMAFLYYRPISTYLHTRSELGDRRGPGRRPEGREGAPRAPARAHDERRGAGPRGPADRVRQARRAALHREGHRRLAARTFGLSSTSAVGREAHPATRKLHAWTISTSCERQLGRRPRAFRRVAARCPFGAPAVTEQQPYDANGVPFPTTYYLTCPHLVAAVSRLEAAGGVERWSAEVAASPELRGRSGGGDRGATPDPPRPRRRPNAAPTAAPRSTGASAARAGRSSSSACTRTSASRSPTPATGSAS